MCEFDPELRWRQQSLRGRRRRRRGGTLAPLLTISLLILSTGCAALSWHFRKQILSLQERFFPSSKPLPRQPSISELEMMEVDPFKCQYESIKTFSVQYRKNEINKV